MAVFEDSLKDFNPTMEGVFMITLSLTTGALGIYFIRYMWKSRQTSRRIEDKQRSCKESIAKFEEYVNSNKISERRRDKIVGMKFTDLQKQLQTDDLTAEEVLKAYQSKAAETNKDLNFMVEPVKEALQTAKLCDQNKKSEKKRPLHGIPVSLKENYYMKGYDSTGGMSFLLGKPARDDGVLVKVLKYQGAVPFVRTNIPQSMMTNKTTEELVTGQTLIMPTCGPMSRDVDTLVETMRAVLCPYHFELDPEVPPIPFRNQIYDSTTRLRIGYYIDDGNVKAIPGVVRAVLEAKTALEKMGHTLVPFTVPRSEYMFGDLFMNVCFGDGGSNFLGQMADDVVDPSIQLIIMTYRLPKFIQNIIIAFMNMFSGEKLPGKVLKSMQGVKSVKDWWALANKLEEYKAEFKSAWRASELDAVICPTMPYVAVPTGCVKYLVGGVSYTTLYNLLNYPAGCVPVTKVTAVDQAKMKDYPTDTTSHKYIKKFFSADTGGLPVTVQCVGLPFEEELVLRVMKELDIGLKRFGPQ